MSELRNSRSGPIKIQQFGATDENIARLVNQDWDELASLVVLSQSSVPLEMLPEMAETLSEFMKAHDLLEQFLKWCIEQEVSSTKEFNLLFREDSFVIMLLNRLVFGDLGIKYLSGVLQNLITSIIKYEKPLELNRMKVNDEEWSANVQVIMKFLGDFLPHFAKSARLCPIPMRYTFSCLQSAVDAKFGKQETPFALEFIFFHYICPAVINPKKYDIVKEAIPLHALPGLIATSKLLNDLAMNATDKWKEKEVSDFILKRHPMLLQHLHLLTDEKDIANTKQMISSSVSTNSATVEERQRAANRWKQFLTALAYYHRKGSMTSMAEETKLFPQSQEMFQLKQLEFLDVVNSPDWNLEKDKPMLISSIKDKERPTIISCKCECTINCPLPLVFAAIKEFQFHKKTDSFISQVESLFVSQFYSENYLVYRLPFPLNNRDMVFYQWEYEEDTRCCIVQENLSGKVQRKKGMVRAQMMSINKKNGGKIMYVVSGWLVEKVENNVTRVVRISQLDPKGSLPQWITNAMATSQSNKLGYLKDLVEKRMRKGSIKRDSRSSRDSRASRDSGTWDYY